MTGCVSRQSPFLFPAVSKYCGLVQALRYSRPQLTSNRSKTGALHMTENHLAEDAMDLLPSEDGVDTTAEQGGGSIEDYITAALRKPMLSLEIEQCLARRYRATRDPQAARQLTEAHLRLVIAVARTYQGYGLPKADLIQEGNIGLLKGVERFDDSVGVRLSSYALAWIRAEISSYVIRNIRLVRFATKKQHYKLFFKLRAARESGRAMSQAQVSALSRTLNISEEDIRDMEVRLTGRDLDMFGGDSADPEFAPVNYLGSTDQEPSEVLSRRCDDLLRSDGIAEALERLDPRARRIIEARWLSNDDGSGPPLRELAGELGVSIERVRQIETDAMKKMKRVLSSFMRATGHPSAADF